MKRFAFAGASGRGFYMYAEPLYKEFGDQVQLVGVYDINPVRAQIFSEECGNIPVYKDFQTMLSEGRPDAVIVTTIDCFHHEYIIQSLNAGCDAIVEKPLTIDAEKCRAIIEAERRSGKSVIVTFNYRFIPNFTRIKEIISSGIIGDILSVDFEWMLDTSHGADYFRRWHRYMEKSGGLLVHKATHHFDLVNWWIEQEPVEVFALGSLAFYGPKRDRRGERCLTCEHTTACEFYLNLLKDDKLRVFYLEAEKEDGYIRDQCVFSEEINIYDTMSAVVKYSGGTQLTYSLVAYSPCEGWQISINGTKGRIEAQEYESGNNALDPFQKIKIYNRAGDEILFQMQKQHTGHGGSDERIRKMIFNENIPDPLGHKADLWAGAISCAIGIAANQSIKSGEPVKIKEILEYKP